FRIWSAVHFFFPAKNLTGEDWDTVVRQAIPEFEGAHNASEYTFDVARLIHHLYDSHGWVFAPEFDEQFGARPPVELQFVAGLPVITAIRDADLQRKSGVEAGDVVTAIDGERVENRIAFWTKA